MKKTLMVALLAMFAFAFNGCNNDDEDYGDSVELTTANLEGYWVNTTIASKNTLLTYQPGDFGYKISTLSARGFSFNVWEKYFRGTSGDFVLLESKYVETTPRYYYTISNGKVYVSTEPGSSKSTLCDISLYKNYMKFKDPEFGTIILKKVSQWPK